MRVPVSGVVDSGVLRATAGAVLAALACGVLVASAGAVAAWVVVASAVPVLGCVDHLRGFQFEIGTAASVARHVRGDGGAWSGWPSGGCADDAEERWDGGVK